MKYYYYLFFRIYKFIKKLGNYDIYFSTCLNISTFESFLFMSIYFTALKNHFPPEMSMIIVISVGIFILLVNIFIFLYKKRYLKIIKMFENETKRQKQISSAIVMLIFIFNLIFLIYAITSY